MVHNLEQEPDQYQEEEDHTNMVNINSINFNSKCSVVTANLKTSHQLRIIVPYKVDTGSDGNIRPLHIYKKLFPWSTTNKNIQLKHKQNKNNTIGHM